MRINWKGLLSGLMLLLLCAPTYSQTSSNSEIEIITQQKIQGIITILEYSPDGNLIACGGEKENSIKIWDISSGKIIGKLEGHTEATTALAFSKDGTKLMSAAEDKKVMMWSLLEWQLIDSMTTSAAITDIKRNPDNDESFYGISDKGELKSWSLSSFQTPTSIYATDEHFTSLAIHNGSAMIGDQNGNIHVYSLTNKQVLISKEISKFAVMRVKVVEKDNQLITACTNGKVQFWNTENLSEIKTINASVLPLSAFDVNVSANRMVTVAQNRMIKVWDLSGELLKEYKSASEESDTRAPIRAVKISPDGSTMASSGYRGTPLSKTDADKNVIHIWDLKRGTLFKVLEGRVNPIYSFDFHPVENKLVTLGEGNILSFWNIEMAEKYGEMQLQDPKRELAGMRKPSADDVTLDKVTRFKRVIERVSEGDLGAVKDIGKGKGKDLGVGLAKRMFKEQSIITFSEQGNYLLTKLENDEIRLYDFKTGRPTYLQSVYSYQLSINQLQTSPDEKYLAVIGSGDSAISIIDMSTRKFVTKLSTPAPQGKFRYVYEANSLAFSPDGKYLAVCFNTGKTFVYETTYWQLAFENILPDNLGYVESPFVNFTKNGQYMVVKTMAGVRKYDTELFNIFNTEPLKIDGYTAPMDKPQDYAIIIKDNELYFENLLNGTVTKGGYVQPNQITNIAINRDGLVGITYTSGQFQLIDPNVGKEKVLLVADGDNYIFKTDQNYYKVSKEGYDLVTFRIGNRAYPFEQFDAVFNRPDLVLKQLGCTDNELIALYEKAYQKRIKKLGLNPTTSIVLEDIPNSQLTNAAEIASITQKNSVLVKCDLSDRKALKSYNIWVNNVPVHGKNGKTISGKSYKIEENVPLIHGLNKIQIACRNTGGYESLIQTFYVEKEGESPKKNLYLVTVGTSDYADDRYDLNYPVKDANDLVTLFKSNPSGVYHEIHSKTLADKQVTSENISGLKQFLAQAGPNDVVIVFVAGHGLLDANFDYYFGTHNIDFSAPSKKGLAYEKLEQILDGIAANKKILIMDTCHSGEVDKEDVFFAETESNEDEDENISFRAVGAAVKENTTNASPTRLAGELFNDLRKGTGATVISSAGGAEFAMESDEWKNGLFTYCLLNGLKNRTADLNGDGKIMLLELQTYVVEQVRDLSHGKQIPNTRIKNIELDFQIW